MESILSSSPMDLVHIDFLKLEVNPDTYKDVLVVTDHFTGYAQAYFCANQTAITTAKCLQQKFFRHYGLPDRILSDQGRNFESQLIKELCAVGEVEKIRTTPYHPQTNGQCERFNRTLIGMIGTLDPADKARWPEQLEALCQAYNSTVHRVTGFAPSYLMYGRVPRLPIDVELGLPLPRTGMQPHSRYVANLKKRLSWAFEQVREARRKYSDANAGRRAVTTGPLQKGDTCLVRVVAWQGKHKLQDRWESEPYEVLGRLRPGSPVYQVQRSGGPVRTLHRNLLLPLAQPLTPSTKPVSARADIQAGKGDGKEGAKGVNNDGSKSGVEASPRTTRSKKEVRRSARLAARGRHNYLASLIAKLWSSGLESDIMEVDDDSEGDSVDYPEDC